MVVPATRRSPACGDQGILEHKNLAPAFRAQVEQFVSRAAQKTGEIEIPRLKRLSIYLLHRFCFLFSYHFM